MGMWVMMCMKVLRTKREKREEEVFFFFRSQNGHFDTNKNKNYNNNK